MMPDLYQACPCGSGKKTKFCCYVKRKLYNDLSPTELLKKSADFRLQEICINADWQETGLAHILVVRQLFSLRSLASLYEVDVFCLGLKNTLCQVNINAEDVQTLKNQGPFQFVNTSYEEIRSIILGAIEYAQKLGFEPSPEVTSSWERSKHLIEFQRPYETKLNFGKDGKPFYIQREGDDPIEIMKILSPLVNAGQATMQSLSRSNMKPESLQTIDSEEDLYDDSDEYEEEDESEEEDTFEDRCDYITEDLEEGYYEDAREGSEALLEDYPEEAMSYFYMATTLAVMGESETGITYLKRAIELEPAGEFYHNLGRAYLELGKLPEALAAWEKTIELDGPESAIGQESLKEIDRLKAQMSNEH